jgi:hypothetical protein
MRKVIMKFEQSLYEAMCGVYPAITVRGFSSMLGKSEGYWSSITAQGLAVSNSALVNLMDVLEARKILMTEGSQVSKRVGQIQELIRVELINRFESMTGLASVVDPMDSDENFYGAMPFFYCTF